MQTSTTSLTESDRKHQIHSLHHPVDADQPLVYVRGQGIMVQDVEGKQYIDGLSALWNVNIGHGRAELANAAAEQMKTLAYYSGYAGSSTIPSIQLAERLIELCPEMGAVFFTSGGAEANESAFKTARYYWNAKNQPAKVKVISRHYGYHGVTLQAMSATGLPAYWNHFGPRVPGFLQVETCYPYRFQGAQPGETAGAAAARALEEAILREGPETVAAFIGEPIHGAGGVIYPTDDYWPKVREICTRHNVLLIADEIITGFGRTGRWFGLEHWKIQPDIFSFAKGVTSGYIPLGGIVMSKTIRDTIHAADPANRWMHGFTNSGHPTCCAVALRNLEIIARESLVERSAEMGTLLLQELKQVLGGHPHVGDIRGGKGLLAAVEFVEDRASRRNFKPDRKIGMRLQTDMRTRGLVTRSRPSAGDHPAAGDQVLFAPPLVISAAEVRAMVGILRDSVAAVLGI